MIKELKYILNELNKIKNSTRTNKDYIVPKELFDRIYNLINHLSHFEDEKEKY